MTSEIQQQVRKILGAEVIEEFGIDVRHIEAMLRAGAPSGLPRGMDCHQDIKLWGLYMDHVMAAYAAVLEADSLEAYEHGWLRVNMLADREKVATLNGVQGLEALAITYNI